MTDIDNKAEFAKWREYHIGVYRRTPSEAEECHDFPIWLAARASAPPPAAEPICATCKAIGAAYKIGKDSGAAPAVRAVGEPVMHQVRMRAPGGNTGPWHEVNRAFYEQFSAQPDIGDGFTYETRALVVAIQPPPSAEPAPADPQPQEQK